MLGCKTAKSARGTFSALLGLIVVGGVACTACTSTTTSLAKRFSLEHSCQLDQVRVREHGGSEYIAEGCGQRASYVCSSIASMGDVKSTAGNCAEEGVRPPGPVAPPERRPQIGVEDPPR